MSESIRTLTLTDFLLARIAEDEQRRSLWERVDDVFHLDDNRAHWARTRRHIECEAKRRIVDRYVGLAETGDTGDARWVLPLLALSYADHPDYREEWRA